ncbi:hypothetical protein O3Q52_39245 [Streptomyces sp. ActVer]|uniref:hypothetical protein n=1 Tax=Streptomyces sp. ActVer TaxID=3014558 RepID=UPI0022B33C8C|nr:hypothetical protein [Streptomyces sp. ActVer]MCZ4514073.1 hypothetical protein [Streptomyces sp. ActVer]
MPTIAPTRRPAQGLQAPFHKTTGPSGVGVLDQNPRILRARQEGPLRAEQWRPGEHRPGRLGKAAVDARMAVTARNWRSPGRPWREDTPAPACARCRLGT